MKVHFLFVTLLSSILLQGISQEPKSISIALNDSLHINCRLIEPGEFTMGSPNTDSAADAVEKPQRSVLIKHAFYLGITPVTVQQFRLFIEETGYKTVAETDGIGGHGYNDEKDKFEGLFPKYTWKYTGWVQTANDPVVNVSWIDANKFCEWLSRKTGKIVRLPSEEEWEYACRAGTSTIYFTGDNANDLENYANVSEDALREKLVSDDRSNINRSFPFNDGYPFTAPVGKFRPNPWGLYDMIGNVYQICDGAISASEPAREYNNVARGGAYNSDPEYLRCACRGSIKASSKYSYIGFRIAVTP